ncbi:MAG: hypothetical protein ACHBN1_04360 [Heteroscytonema crispum UTEX LB 1556]
MGIGHCCASAAGGFPDPGIWRHWALVKKNNYQLTTTNYQLPTTNYQLPTTN